MVVCGGVCARWLAWSAPVGPMASSAGSITRFSALVHAFASLLSYRRYRQTATGDMDTHCIRMHAVAASKQSSSGCSRRLSPVLMHACAREVWMDGWMSTALLGCSVHACMRAPC